MHRRAPGRRAGTRGPVGLVLVAVVLIAGGVATLVLRRSTPAVVASTGSPTSTPPVIPPSTPPPTTPAPTPTKPTVTPQTAVDTAVAAGRARGARVAVAVHDRQTGAFYVGGEADAAFPSASLVKTFIATRLLVDGQAKDPATRDVMWKMITLSDDDSASQLYPVAGGSGLVDWISRRYQVTGLKPTTRSGAWGLTQVTARAMVTFYAAMAKDPLVAPWLLDAMAHMQPKGSDGWNQEYGIPQATQGWRVKQGWLCCVDNLSRLYSTGFVNADRYTVALLTEDDRDTYGDAGEATVTLMAQSLLPGGAIPALP